VREIVSGVKIEGLGADSLQRDLGRDFGGESPQKLAFFISSAKKSS